MVGTGLASVAADSQSTRSRKALRRAGSVGSRPHHVARASARRTKLRRRRTWRRH